MQKILSFLSIAISFWATGSAQTYSVAMNLRHDTNTMNQIVYNLDVSVTSLDTTEFSFVTPTLYSSLYNTVRLYGYIGDTMKDITNEYASKVIEVNSMGNYGAPKLIDKVKPNSTQVYTISFVSSEKFDYVIVVYDNILACSNYKLFSCTNWYNLNQQVRLVKKKHLKKSSKTIADWWGRCTIDLRRISSSKRFIL